MNGLPIPRSLYGWICAIMLLVFLFIGYYLYLFPELDTFYFEKPGGIPTLYSITTGGSQCEPLEIKIHSPRQVASFGKRWVYITLRNTSNSTITVAASLVITPELKGWYMPFLFGGSTSDAAAISFPSLQPYATAYGRIPLFVTGDITSAILHISVSVPEAKDCSIHIEQPPKNDPRRFLVHSFIEQLLLPPWSNWLLAAVGLLVPALVELVLEPRNQERTLKISGKSLARMIVYSLNISLLFIAIVLLGVSAVWCPTEKEAGGWWNIFIVIVSFVIVISLIIWRSPGLEFGLLRYISRWLQNLKYLQPARELWQRAKEWPRQRAWLRLLINLMIIVLTTGLLLWIISHTKFPLLKPLYGIFLILGGLEFLRALLRAIYSQKSGGRNESESDGGNPASVLGDKSEPRGIAGYL